MHACRERRGTYGVVCLPCIFYVETRISLACFIYEEVSDSIIRTGDIPIHDMAEIEDSSLYIDCGLTKDPKGKEENWIAKTAL